MPPPTIAIRISRVCPAFALSELAAAARSCARPQCRQEEAPCRARSSIHLRRARSRSSSRSTDVRAVRIHAHGGPEILQLDEVPPPAPGPRELLVRLRATSVNHRDIWIRRGHPHPAYHVDLPAILGIDVCGDVLDAGD